MTVDQTKRFPVGADEIKLALDMARLVWLASPETNANDALITLAAVVNHSRSKPRKAAMRKAQRRRS